jgi:hypothetical protein
MAADAPAPQAHYRVLRGIVHHPGGVASPGDIIPLPPNDGDPLCEAPGAVLERLPEESALVGEGEGRQTGERPDDAPVGAQIDGPGPEPIAPAPKRRRAAAR